MHRCDIAFSLIQSRSTPHALVRERKAARDGVVAEEVALRKALRGGPRRDDRHRRVAVDEHELAVVLRIEAIELVRRVRAVRDEVEEGRVDDVPRAPLAVVEAVRLDVEDEVVARGDVRARIARRLRRDDVGRAGESASRAAAGQRRPRASSARAAATHLVDDGQRDGHAHRAREELAAVDAVAAAPRRSARRKDLLAHRALRASSGGESTRRSTGCRTRRAARAGSSGSVFFRIFSQGNFDDMPRS